MFFNRITRFVGVAVSWMMVSTMGAPVFGASAKCINSKRKAVAVAAMLIGACLEFVPAQTVHAGEYEFTKSILWSPRGALGEGPIAGEAGYLMHVMGDDKHDTIHLDSPRGPDSFDDLLVGLLNSGQSNRDPLKTPVEHFWSPSIAINALPYNSNLQPLLTVPSGLVHAFATSGVSLAVSRPFTPGGIHGTIHGEGVARADIALPLHPPETASAQAASGGRLKFSGEIEARKYNSDDSQERRGSVFLAKDGWVSGRGVASSSDPKPGGRVRDPISLSFFDAADESVLGSSILYQDAFSASGDARIDWDLAGDLVLTAGPEGDASVQISTPSEWVLNPLNATAVLTNGVFTVGGMFAGLPWDIVLDAGTLTARLPMSAIPHTFEILYDASSLPDSVGDVRAELDSDGDGEAFDYETIPAPGTLAILGLACAITSRRRRID